MLRPKQQIFLLHILQGKTVVEAAQAARVAESTARTWMRQKAVIKELHNLQKEILEQCKNEILHTILKSIRKLNLLLNSEKESIALGASKTLLEVYKFLHESIGIEQKIEELEEKFND